MKQNCNANIRNLSTKTVLISSKEPGTICKSAAPSFVKFTQLLIALKASADEIGNLIFEYALQH